MASYHLKMDFDLRYISTKFNDSLLDESDIELCSFLDGYLELIKFCRLMGKLWAFVGHEIGKNVGALMTLRRGDTDEHYRTMETMIKYEIGNNPNRKTNLFPGCLPLLLLHRGLDFLRHFLKETYDLEPGASMTPMGRRVYANTIGNFHSWIVQQAAHLAMYALPTRQTLMQQITNGNEETLVEVFPQLMDVLNELYRRTGRCLRENDLLNLL